MAIIERRFIVHEGVQIWEIEDGASTFYRSDPIDDDVFTGSLVGDVAIKISICNFFGTRLEKALEATGR
jgi:hypothetical protein